MKGPINTLVIGAREKDGKRNIGAEVVHLLRPPYWRVGGIVTTKSYHLNEGDPDSTNLVEYPFDPNDSDAFKTVLKKVRPQIVFLAIPTTDHGEKAWAYTRASIEAKADVSTAEKGMAAWQFDKISLCPKRIDIGAALGGGTRILYHPKLRHLRHRKKVTVYGFFNATCNFACWNLGEGISVDEMLDQASRRSITEPAPPGMELTLRTLLNGEMPDIRMKVPVFYNELIAQDRKYLLPSNFEEVFLTDEDVERLASPYEKRRLLVTITNQKQDANHKRDVIGLMQTEKDGWYISIGFVPLGNSPIADWMASVKDINNGFLLHADGHSFKDSGPGAGPATAQAMLEGAERLVDLRS